MPSPTALQRKVTIRELQRKPGEAQSVQIMKGAALVGFVNRQGMPAIITIWHDREKPDSEDIVAHLVENHGKVPPGADYIGSAEFGGGQVLMHCFVVRAKT